MSVKQSSCGAYAWAICAMLFWTTACNNPDPASVPEKKVDSAVAKALTTTQKMNIIFFGNSLTAGYGLDLTEAFPHHSAQIRFIALSL